MTYLIILVNNKHSQYFQAKKLFPCELEDILLISSSTHFNNIQEIIHTS